MHIIVFVCANAEIISLFRSRSEFDFQQSPNFTDLLSKVEGTRASWGIVEESCLEQNQVLTSEVRARLCVIGDGLAAETLASSRFVSVEKALEYIVSFSENEAKGHGAELIDTQPVPLDLPALVHGQLMAAQYGDSGEKAWNAEHYNNHLKALASTIQITKQRRTWEIAPGGPQTNQVELASCVLTARLTKFLITNRLKLHQNPTAPTMPTPLASDECLSVAWTDAFPYIFAFIDLIDPTANVTIVKENGKISLSADKPAQVPRDDGQLPKERQDYLQFLREWLENKVEGPSVLSYAAQCLLVLE